MPIAKFEIIGRGVYAVPEAARLAGVSAPRIHRWLRGYEYKVSSGCTTAPPVWTPQLAPIDGQVALSFRDLVEVRFVDAFLREGVSWRAIRLAGQRARELFGDPHPFSTRRFKTDGKAIFAELQHDSEHVIVELGHRQRYFERVIAPYLKGIEFEDDEPTRWWPLGRSKSVVIDPGRSFGQPIVSKRGIPTSVLARAMLCADSVREVARWYETDARSVRLAVEYEDRLAA